MEKLTNELNKLENNSDLKNKTQLKIKIAKEKYEIYLQPIIRILEHVYEITVKQQFCETRNEQQFIKDFASVIENALNNLKNSDKYAMSPFEGWQFFKKWHNFFITKISTSVMQIHLI